MDTSGTNLCSEHRSQECLLKLLHYLFLYYVYNSVNKNISLIIASDVHSCFVFKFAIAYILRSSQIKYGF